ncbi:hypothetical protein CHUAL_013377 [Chamberlinius hualienensis]
MGRHHRAVSYVFLGTIIFICVFIVYRLEPSEHASIMSQESSGKHEMGFPFYKNKSMKEVDVDMQKRRRIINHICRRLRRNVQAHKKLDYKQLDHVIVDDKYRLLYCYVPKVACTNWKRVLLILKSKATNQLSNPLDIPANDSHRQHIFRTLDNYTHDEIQYRLSHYYKFMFVRHPFERLLSAFRNKFQQNYSVYFHQRFGRLIIQRHRLNASEESLNRGNDVMFNEFVDYILDKRTLEDGLLNEHWRSMDSLCHPCFIHYDAIGKYEDLGIDAEYVLEKAGVKNLVRFPKINRTVDTFSLIDDYFKNLTKSQILRLHHMYSLDFKMFGYKYADLDIT